MTRKTTERMIKINEMYVSGKSLAACGVEFGVTAQAIKHILKHHFPNTEMRKSRCARQKPLQMPRRYMSFSNRDIQTLSGESSSANELLIRLEDSEVVVPIDLVSYIAGLFDGEGCVNFTRSKGTNSLVLRATIVNTNRRVLEFVQSIFGGRIAEMKRVKDNWKIAYRLNLANRHAVRFLAAIDPWLMIKDNQATIAFEWEFLRDDGYSDEIKSSYELLSRQLTWLNKKGPSNEEEPFQKILNAMEATSAAH